MNYTPLLIGVLIVLTANAVMLACIWSNVSDIRKVLYIIKRLLKDKEVKK